MMGLSIIVPVYNAALYIKRCMDSLLSLNVKNYEVVIVDDASTDKTGDICLQYQETSPKVHYYRIVHGGPQAARMEGVVRSEGDYITFVDSDDWVDSDFYDALIMKLEADDKIDIGIGAAVRAYDNNVSEDMFSEQRNVTGFLQLSHDEALDELFRWRKYGWTLWGKVYRRELFHGFQIASNHIASEDLEWNWKLFRRANETVFFSKKYYHYFQNKDGLTGQGMDVIERCNEDLEVYQQILTSEEISVTIRGQLRIIGLQRIPIILREMYFRDLTPDEKTVRQYLLLAEELSEGIDRDFESEAFAHVIDHILGGYDICDSYYKEITSTIVDTAIHLQCRFHDMYVYGTGMVAKYVRLVLDNAGVSIAGHTITKKENSDLFMGKYVFSLDTIAYKPDKTAFLLALDRHNADEVITTLIRHGYANYAEVDLGEPFGY